MMSFVRLDGKKDTVSLEFKLKIIEAIAIGILEIILKS